MLFRKKIEPSCAYCVHARGSGEEQRLCLYHGVVKPWEHCRRFRYDPLQRKPEAPLPPKTDIDGSAFEL